MHELTAPTIELVVDKVGLLADGHQVLRAVDAEHGVHYVAAADTERHPQHRRRDDVVLPAPAGTERGVLGDPHAGLPYFGGVR